MCLGRVVRCCLILCCSDTGVHDRDGRRVFLFLAGRFAVSSIPPSQLLLLIIRLLDEASASPFTVVYAHTACGDFFVFCSFFPATQPPPSPFQACPICPLPKSQRMFTILSRARKSPEFPALFFVFACAVHACTRAPVPCLLCMRLPTYMVSFCA